MITRIVTVLVTVASLLLVSCYPYPEPLKRRTKPNTKATPPPATQEEQAKILEQERLKKEEADRLKNQGNPDRQISELPTGKEKTPSPSRRTEYPVAKKAPGREGLVISPYNNKPISIRNEDGTLIPSGTLVQDPTFLTEKKYFRVP